MNRSKDAADELTRLRSERDGWEMAKNMATERNALAARVAALEAVLRDLVEIAEISTGVSFFGYPEKADGPLPRAKAVLAATDNKGNLA